MDMSRVITTQMGWSNKHIEDRRKGKRRRRREKPETGTEAMHCSRKNVEKMSTKITGCSK